MKNSESDKTYVENLYPTKLENLKEMDNFLNTYHIPKLNNDLISNLNRSLTPNEIKAVIKSCPIIKSPVQKNSEQNFTKNSIKC